MAPGGAELIKRFAVRLVAPSLAMVAVVAVSLLVPSPARIFGILTASCGSYAGVPVVTGVSPNFGGIAGGTSVSITGSGFCTSVSTSVQFGTTAAASFVVIDDTHATAVSPAHAARTVDVTVTTAAGTSATSTADQFTYIPPTAACTFASVASDKVSPQPEGTSVTFTASAGLCTSPLFKWWIWTAATGWTLLRDYSASNTFVLNTTGMAPGTYTIDVWVENSGSAMGPNSYETFGLEAWVVIGCAFASMTPNPAPTTGSVTFTVTAGGAGCTAPLYQFQMYSTGTGWVTVQPYSATNTFTIDTATLANTNYSVDVWVKQTGSPLSFETWALSTIPKGACGSPTLSAAPASPQEVGSTITFTAAGGGCAAPMFKYFIYPGAGGTWQMLRDYNANGTFAWDSTGWKTGTYSIDVYVQKSGSTAPYDTYALLSFTVTGTITANVSTTPSTPHALGGAVTINATASGSSAPQYQFWFYDRVTAVWTMIQGYSTTASATWTPSHTGTYALVVYVKQTGSGNLYDTYAALSYSAT